MTLLACAAVCCGTDEGSAAGSRSSSNARSSGDSDAAISKAADEKKVHRTERPLPAFSGWTLDGERFSISSALGKRLMIVFFNPETGGAQVVIEAVGEIAPLRGEHNFEIVGVATGSNLQAAKDFTKQHAINFRVIDDSSASIANRLGLRSPLAIIGVDAEGFITFGFGQLATHAPNAVTLIRSQLKTALRLPDAEDDAASDPFPLAPTFRASVLDQKEDFDFETVRGQPIILMFFLHTCPHCHEALRFMKGQLATMREDQRPVFIGIELTGRSQAVRDTLKKDGLDFFPVLFDHSGGIKSDYGVFGGVPDIFLIDRSGRITSRVQGWRPETDGPLMRMRIAKISRAPVPMLLRTTGYSGSEVCSVCHEQQDQTWRLTSHATAYDTLVRHGSESDPECVGCHVVGYGEEGGFEISPRTAPLENVGCESCHGRGGPHLSPDFVHEANYATACESCHDIKHSLGFEYAKFMPRISHAANAYILDLPSDERRRILAERGAVQRELLPSESAHTGSESCGSCHAAEYETWKASAHATSISSLGKSGDEQNPSCQSCHTTGFGKDGGFPSSGVPADHPDLARVGCESCHGAGGEHVANGTAKRGSILSLGDKCDSCVILQICGSCHDDANDPGFEFEVQEKIDAIRHGTIEAGTGRPLQTP